MPESEFQSTQTSSSNIEKSATEQNDFLIKSNFPEDIVDNLSDDAINKLLSSIGNNRILSTKVQQLESKQTSGVDITYVLAKLVDSNNSYVGDAVCIYWEYTDKYPSLKFEDKVTVTWNDNYFTYSANSFYAEDYSRNKNADAWTCINFCSTPAEMTLLNSLGHWTTLSPLQSENAGVIIFKLLTKSPLSSEDIADDNLTILFEAKPILFKIIIGCSTVVIVFFLLFIIIRKNRKRSRYNNTKI